MLKSILTTKIQVFKITALNYVECEKNNKLKEYIVYYYQAFSKLVISIYYNYLDYQVRALHTGFEQLGIYTLAGNQ